MQSPENNNPFIKEFLLPRQEGLRKLKELTEEIEEEKLGWYQSGVAEHIIRTRQEIFSQSNRARLANQKEIEFQISTERAAMYGDIGQEKGLEVIEKRMISQLPPKILLGIIETMELADEHRKSYREAIRPLTDEQTKQREELVNA